MMSCSAFKSTLKAVQAVCEHVVECTDLKFFLLLNLLDVPF